MVECIVLVMNRQQMIDFLGVDPGWGWWLFIDNVDVDPPIGEILPWERRMFF
jgi:hypothetical protein